jgi:hypothetical protein
VPPLAAENVTMTKFYVLDPIKCPPGVPFGLASRIPATLYERMSSNGKAFYLPEAAAKAPPKRSPVRVTLPAPPPPPQGSPAHRATSPKAPSSVQGRLEKVQVRQAADAIDHAAFWKKMRDRLSGDVARLEARLQTQRRSEPPRSARRDWDMWSLNTQRMRNSLVLMKSNYVRAERELAEASAREKLLVSMAPRMSLDWELLQRADEERRRRA